jgi:hypothetical protein
MIAETNRCWNEIVPDALQQLAGAEGRAARLHIYQPELVTGLLQTEDYADADAALGRWPGAVQRLTGTPEPYTNAVM